MYVVMDKIKISVIMPVYNSGKYLSTAVNSILKQSFKDFELILIDDGSTDGTSEVCDKYAQQDERVVVIHQKNKGICNARNTALNIAKGEYIAFSDHDDEYLPGFLENAYREAVTNNAELVKVGKNEILIKENKFIRKKISNYSYRIYNKTDIQTNYFTLVNSGCLTCLWDGLFKRSIIDKYKIKLDESYKSGGEDIDFMQKYIIHVETFITIDKIYYNHYIRKGISTSTKLDSYKIDAHKRIIKIMLEAINKLNIDIKNYQFEYTYLLLHEYIAPLCYIYSVQDNIYNKEEIRHLLKLIKKEPFYYVFCSHQNVLKFFSISKKYGLLYSLLKYNLYNLIIIIYRLRAKQF